jgi:hypothetical protein
MILVQEPKITVDTVSVHMHMAPVCFSVPGSSKLGLFRAGATHEAMYAVAWRANDYWRH